ncbi:hypothetical protein F5X96DRAFT_694779 [Biscogniauxia mediterranea]|nr:hypothetical protein F5X96DRAFT_694779 [Biscogniauxia mediterranea]
MALYTYPDGTVTALPPPDGYIVDFENPQRQFVDALSWTSGAISIVTLLFVCQRLYVSFAVEKRVSLDDGKRTHHLLCIFFSKANNTSRFSIHRVGTKRPATLFKEMLSLHTEYQVLLLTITAVTIHTAAIGALGTHSWEVPFDIFATFFKQSYPLSILYMLCTLFAKMALLIYYVHLMPRSWYCLANVFTMVVCIDQPSIAVALDIIGLVVDLVLLVIPITMVMHTSMHWKQKAGLATMFAIGFGAIIIATVHSYVDVRMKNEADITWVSAGKLYWLIIEANVLVICATFPSLARFFRHIMPKFTSQLPAIKLAGSSDNDLSFLVFRGFGEKGQKTTTTQYNRFISTDYALDRFSQIDSERTVSRGSGTDKVKTDISWHITPIGHEATASREDIIKHLRGAYK